MADAFMATKHLTWDQMDLVGPLEKDTLVVSDAPSNFEGNADPFRLPIDPLEAYTVGGVLKKQEVISMVFLLIDDVDRALALCRALEEGRYPPVEGHEVGSFFMASLVNTGIQREMKRWKVKIACALHLVRRYRVSSASVPRE